MALAAVVRAQEDAGLEPIIDAGFGVGRPRSIAGAHGGLTNRPVKAVLDGPYSSTGRPRTRSPPSTGCAATSSLLPSPAARSSKSTSRRRSGSDRRGRTSAVPRGHLRLLDGVSGVHCSLAVTGGNAGGGIETCSRRHAPASPSTVAAPTMALIAGAPSERGAIIGALSVVAGSDDRRSSSGRSPIPRPLVAAVGRGSAWRAQARWPTCHGRWPWPRWSGLARPHGSPTCPATSWRARSIHGSSTREPRRSDVPCRDRDRDRDQDLGARAEPTSVAVAPVMPRNTTETA
jgi:hypothetical protein